jgi:hypothetical protein
MEQGYPSVRGCNTDLIVLCHRLPIIHQNDFEDIWDDELQLGLPDSLVLSITRTREHHRSRVGGDIAVAAKRRV